MCLKNLKLLFLSLVLLLVSWLGVSQDFSSEQSLQETQTKLSNNSSKTTNNLDKKTQNSKKDLTMPSDLQENLSLGLATQSTLLTEGLDILTTLDKQLETLEKQSTTLEQQLQDSKSTILELRKSLSDSKQIVETLREELEKANETNDKMTVIIDGQDDYFLYLNREFEKLNRRINLGSGLGMCFGGISGTAIGAGVTSIIHKDYALGGGLIAGGVITFSIWSICHFAFKIF